jgi:hypothetical protein
MIDYVKFDVPQRLVVANGKTEDIVGEGTMQVFLESGCSLLHNVKHVPTSKKYLLSVGKAYLDGINVNILGIECYLTDLWSHALSRWHKLTCGIKDLATSPLTA